MQVRHILAAADESEEGRIAIEVAAMLGRAVGARVEVLTVITPVSHPMSDSQVLEGLRGVVRGALRRVPHPPPIATAVATGLPGVEIGRFAETSHADLIVIGRKARSPTQRLMVGDTADSVARRSPTPCLFVSGAPGSFARVLVALDGSERGMGVLLPAMDFTRATGARLRAISVEPASPTAGGSQPLQSGRSSRLQEMVNGRRAGVSLGDGRWEGSGSSGNARPVVVRQGAIVDEIIREVESYRADVLVVGYHRGGPAGIIEAGSVARRLIHEAPCAVLTVPL